jgi:hypothetical protein
MFTYLLTRRLIFEREKKTALENIFRHKLCLMFLRHLTYRNFVDLNMITLAGYEGILVYLYPVPPTTP